MAIKVTSKSISKLAQELQKQGNEIVKNVDKTVDKTIKDAEKYCNFLFQNASYDGQFDVTVKASKGEKGTWTLSASGNDVEYIEYGTGVYSEMPDSLKRDYWFYTIEPGNRFNTEFGGYATYKTKGTTSYKLPDGRPVSIEKIEEVWFNHRNTMSKRKGSKEYMDAIQFRKKYPTLEDFAKMYKTSSGETKEKSWSAFTRGNEPNHCMQQTKDYIIRELNSRLKK